MIIGQLLVLLAICMAIKVACDLNVARLAVASLITFKHYFIVKILGIIKILKYPIKLKDFNYFLFSLQIKKAQFAQLMADLAQFLAHLAQFLARFRHTFWNTWHTF